MDYPLPPVTIKKEKDHFGSCLIMPVSHGKIPGWNYAVTDEYLLSREGKTWDFFKRTKVYSRPFYFSEEDGCVTCECEECISARKQNPNLDKKPEVLLDRKSLFERKKNNK